MRPPHLNFIIVIVSYLLFSIKLSSGSLYDGRHFLAVCLTTQYSDEYHYIQISTQHNSVAEVQLIYHNNYGKTVSSFNISAGENHQQLLDRTHCVENGHSNDNNTIEVLSSTLVRVYLLRSYSGLTMYVPVLPILSLGNTYLITHCNCNAWTENHLVLVATGKSTNISLSFPAKSNRINCSTTVTDNSSIAFNIYRITVKKLDFNLSGAIIICSRPIAIFIQCRCIQARERLTVQQLYPYSTWNRCYFEGPLSTPFSRTLSISAIDQSVDVMIEGRDSAIDLTLTAIKSIKLQLYSGGYLAVCSKKPVQVLKQISATFVDGQNTSIELSTVELVNRLPVDNEDFPAVYTEPNQNAIFLMLGENFTELSELSVDDVNIDDSGKVICDVIVIGRRPKLRKLTWCEVALVNHQPHLLRINSSNRTITLFFTGGVINQFAQNSSVDYNSSLVHSYRPTASTNLQWTFLKNSQVGISELLIPTSKRPSREQLQVLSQVSEPKLYGNNQRNHLEHDGLLQRNETYFIRVANPNSIAERVINFRELEENVETYSSGGLDASVLAVVISLSVAVALVIVCISGFVISEVVFTKKRLKRGTVSPYDDQAGQQRVCLPPIPLDITTVQSEQTPDS